MRTILSTLILMLTLGLSYAQNSATIKSAADFETLKQKGVLELTLPSNYTDEMIAESAKYYTLYFKVDFNAETKVAKINMIENTERTRHIIVRFLTAAKLEGIKVNGEFVKNDLLFERYLK